MVFGSMRTGTSVEIDFRRWRAAASAALVTTLAVLCVDADHELGSAA